MNNLIINPKLLNLSISIVGAFFFWQGMTLFGELLHDTTLFTVFRVFGGSGAGLLKLVAYIAFLYGILDLRDKNKGLRCEEQAFQLPVLPQQDQMVLTPDDVTDIKLSVIGLEKKGYSYELLSYIKKAATQYRNENSVSDTLGVLDSQMDAGKNQREGSLETVRYIIQTIPMLGFIGTIVELTNSLNLLEKGLNLVRAAMSGAFDATLVALLLTILLTFFYHDYIGKLDVYYARVKSYILDNLISRIYIGQTQIAY